MTTFRRIRDLREDHDLNQQDIAAILNITQSTYSDMKLDCTTCQLIF